MPTRRYAPALTKQQFLKARPRGNYQTYLNYLESKRPGWDANRPLVRQRYRPPVKAPPLPSYASLLGGLDFDTPAQIEARANRMAQQQIAAGQKLIAGEYADAEAEAQRRMKALQAAGREAAAMNAGILSKVGQDYAGAASGLADVSEALSAAMAGATSADVARSNAALQGIGAPGVSVGGDVSAPTIAGPQQAAVENYRGGTLGSNLISTTGVASQLGLGSLISAQNLRATQEAQAAYQGAVSQARAARKAAIRELTLGRPGVAAQYLAQLQESQRQQVALAMSLIGQQKAAQQQAFSQGMTRKQFKAAMQQQTFQQGMTTKQFNQALRQQGISNQQWQQEFGERQRQYNQTLAYNKSEQKRQAKQWKAEQRKGGKTGTPAEYMGTVLSGLGESSFDPKFQNAIASIYYGQPSLAAKQPVRGSKDERQRTNAVISYLMSVYWPNVNAMVQNPKLKAQLRQNFENQLRAWWASAPLPALQAWKLSALKG